MQAERGRDHIKDRNMASHTSAHAKPQQFGDGTSNPATTTQWLDLSGERSK